MITVDTFIDDGKYQNGAGDGDFPLSYIASDNVLGGFMAGAALAKAIGGEGKVYVSNVKPGISTTDQREEGFKAAMAESFPDITVLETQFNDNDANKAASAAAGGVRPQPRPRGRVRRQPVLGARRRRTASAGRARPATIRVVAFDAPTPIVDNLKSGLVDLAIAQHPAEIGYYGVVSAFAASDRPVGPAAIGTGFTVMTRTISTIPNVAKFVYSD